MKNTSWVYLSSSATNILCLLLGTVSGILSARLLGPQGRGEFAVIAYFPGLMGTFCCLAIPQALSFIISKQPERAAEIAAAGVRLGLGFGLLGAIGFAFVVPHFLPDDNRYLTRWVMIACLAAPTMVLYPYMSYIFQGRHLFNWVNALLVLSAAGYAAFIGAFWAAGIISPLTLFLSTIALQMLSCIVYAYRLGASVLTTRVSGAVYAECIRQGLRFFGPVLAATLFTLSDRAILIRTTTLAEIGFYSIAFSLAYPLMVAAGSFVQIGFVEMAGLGNENALVNLMTRRFHMAQVVVVGSACALLLVANPVIYYGFGPKFSPALSATYFMIGGMSLLSLHRVLENSLRAADLVWPGVLSNLSALSALLFLGFLWAPKHGAAGFSLAFLLAQVAGLAILVLFVSRKMSIRLKQLWGLRPNILKEFNGIFWRSLRMQIAHR